MQLFSIDTGKFKIYFTSGVLANNSYVAIGSSNARSTAANGEDFDHNTVGLVYRTGDDLTQLRSVTFNVINGEGNYTDAQVNDLVVFGYNVGNSSGNPPTVII